MAHTLLGTCIGILGGGQLGRMLAQAAQTLGYPVEVFEPQAHCPAGAVANRETNAAYTDSDALRHFARRCAVVTYEFENIPVAPLRVLEGERVGHFRPDWRILEICQNRLREKTWLRENGIPHVRFESVAAGESLSAAIRKVGLPCVVKTADFGYDGKGQLKVTDEAGVSAAEAQFAAQAAVVESWVRFRGELSVVVARNESGQVRTFPVSENIHTNHILDFSILPARVPTAIQAQAEVFLTDEGELLVNELAPRTHNSGHYTLDACPTSQFEQQLRAICGLPLGETALRSPIVMVNILGDAWFSDRDEPRTPNWTALLADPCVKLHLYGKAEARRGRKMGHFTVTGTSADEALARAKILKAQL